MTTGPAACAPAQQAFRGPSRWTCVVAYFEQNEQGRQRMQAPTASIEDGATADRTESVGSALYGRAACATPRRSGRGGATGPQLPEE